MTPNRCTKKAGIDEIGTRIEGGRISARRHGGGGAAVIAQRQQQRIAADQIRSLLGVSTGNVRAGVASDNGVEQGKTPRINKNSTAKNTGYILGNSAVIDRETAFAVDRTTIYERGISGQGALVNCQRADVRDGPANIGMIVV